MSTTAIKTARTSGRTQRSCNAVFPDVLHQMTVEEVASGESKSLTHIDAPALLENLPNFSKANVKQPAFLAAGCRLLTFILENLDTHGFPTQVSSLETHLITAVCITHNRPHTAQGCHKAPTQDSSYSYVYSPLRPREDDKDEAEHDGQPPHRNRRRCRQVAARAEALQQTDEGRQRGEQQRPRYDKQHLQVQLRCEGGGHLMMLSGSAFVWCRTTRTYTKHSVDTLFATRNLDPASG